jgi:transposase
LQNHSSTEAITGIAGCGKTARPVVTEGLALVTGSFYSLLGKVGAARFIEFIKRLVHGSDRKIFLIVDGHPSHKAHKVSTFIESKPIKKRFRLFFLPPYSPELNPDERVWNDLKNGAIGRQAITNPNQLHRAVVSHLRFIQKSPDRVRSYFEGDTTKYAA